MSKPPAYHNPHLFDKYGQQWQKIITRQWDEIWQITIDRDREVPNLIINGLSK